MAEPVNLLTIEEPQLRMMMQDHRFLALLPCLQSPKTKLEGLVKGAAGCPKCMKKLRMERSSAIRAAMSCVQGARGSTLAKLKALLNAKQLRMMVTGSGGKFIKVTL